MKEILEKYGFKYWGGCSCDGYKSDKYKGNGYELKHRVRQNKFRIKKSGSWLTQWLPISDIEKTLNETIDRHEKV